MKGEISSDASPTFKPMSDDYLPAYCLKPVLILGVGNILFGDDGFGPAVIGELEGRGLMPENVCLVDAGTGARKYLFTLALSERRPSEIIIVDAVDKGRGPGEVFEIELDEIPFEKTDDFSMHQVPSSNLLKEIKETGGIKVRIIVCQVSGIPEEIQPGLSDPVEKGLSRVVTMLETEFADGA
jgi:coenzyme F420 hydrogenase subunit delta